MNKKRFFFHSAMTVLWGFSSYLWMDTAIGYMYTDELLCNGFGGMAIIIGIITLIFAWNAVRYFNYWMEGKKYGFC